MSTEPRDRTISKISATEQRDLRSLALQVPYAGRDAKNKGRTRRESDPEVVVRLVRAERARLGLDDQERRK